MANLTVEAIQSGIEKTIGKGPNGSRQVIRTRYLLMIDGVCAVLSLALSFLLRLDSLAVASQWARSCWYAFFLFPALRIGLNGSFGLYRRIWRYASIDEALQILKAASAATAVLLLANTIFLPKAGLPALNSVSILSIDWLVSLFFLGGSRFFLRLWINWLTAHDQRLLGRLTPPRRVLIVGAGNVGTMVLRMIAESPEMGYIPVGFCDDDPKKLYRRINDVPILGNRGDIPALMAKHNVAEVIIAMPTAPQAAIDEVRRTCSKANVPVRVIPCLRDLLSGSLTIDQLRQWRASEVTQPVARIAQSPCLHNILVTGGAGFIGSNFVRYMLDAHPAYRIIVYDKLTYAGNLDNLKGLKKEYGENYVFVRGNICDGEQVSKVMEDFSVDAIVNFAAETHVDRSLMTPEDFVKTNVHGTYHLLEAAKRYQVQRYHQVSTDEVYGQVIRGSFSEQDPIETRSPYSASKAGADLLVQAYGTSFGVPATITRGSNNIGPYQYPEKVVPLFITNALEDRPLPVYGDGLYVRDYQYVLDHCRGIDFVLHHGLPGEVYNLGGGNELAALELAGMILERLGKPPSLIQFVTDRRGQDRRYSLNCAKIRSLGWEPEWTFGKALDVTIAWYLQNGWWWRKLKSGEYLEYYRKQYVDRCRHALQTTAAD